MSEIKNPLELYKYLEKSNCRMCGVPSCLAFAAAVIQGQKRLGDCPAIPKDSLEELQSRLGQKETLEDDQGRVLQNLKKLSNSEMDGLISKVKPYSGNIVENYKRVFG